MDQYVAVKNLNCFSNILQFNFPSKRSVGSVGRPLTIPKSMYTSPVGSKHCPFILPKCCDWLHNKNLGVKINKNKYSEIHL